MRGCGATAGLGQAAECAASNPTQDWVCHPMKSELNFPIGQKEPLDFGQESDGRRWDVAMHLIDGFNAGDLNAAQIPPMRTAS